MRKSLRKNQSSFLFLMILSFLLSSHLHLQGKVTDFFCLFVLFFHSATDPGLKKKVELFSKFSVILAVNTFERGFSCFGCLKFKNMGIYKLG